MIAGLIRLLSGVTPRWVGCAPQVEQRIYIANHASHLDAPLIWSCLPLTLRLRTRPVAAQEYWQRGWLRRFCANRLFHALLIDRLGRADRALAAMAAALDAGDSLILFPEGGRQQGAEDSEVGGVQPFKAGLWHLLKNRPELAVVPVHLARTGRILPKGEFLPLPLLAAVTFGAPIFCGVDEEREVFLERARQAVILTGDLA